MNVFEVVKENVTARQAAEAYGLKVGRTGMACCPFHSDKSPSMKLDERYYCFGCGATGDAVDLTAKLFGIGLREAAVKLAEDFGLNYDSRQKPSVRPRIREPTPEQKYQKEENHCYKVLTDYFHLLREWEKKYAPKQPDEEWNPLFAEALHKKNYLMLSGSTAIRFVPFSVGISCFFFRCTNPVETSFSSVAARVAGVPKPFRSASSGISSAPAVSIAARRESSESFCQGGAWIFFILLTQVLSLLLPE